MNNEKLKSKYAEIGRGLWFGLTPLAVLAFKARCGVDLVKHDKTKNITIKKSESGSITLVRED